jgi:hypothetical protein
MKPGLSLFAAALYLSAQALAPPAQAQGGQQRLFFEGDMVTGAGPGLPAPGCVLSSQYKHGQMVVWRVRILDQAGKAVDDKGVKTVTAELPDGQKFAMHYGPHPKGKTDDYFWTTSWKIPATYPTGTFAYKIVVAGLDGQTHTWAPFNVAQSQLTIVK